MARINDNFVVGKDELQAALGEIAEKLPVNAVRKALRAGAAVIREKARSLAPVRTGALRKAISSGTDRTKNSRVPFAFVNIAKRVFWVETTKRGKRRLKSEAWGGSSRGFIYPRNYAHLVEYGTGPHSLDPQGGRVGGGPPRMHPGSRPQPFFRPAIDTTKSQVMSAIAGVMGEELEKIRVKAAQKARR